MKNIIINNIKYFILIIVLYSFNIISDEISPKDTEIWTPIPKIIDVDTIWKPSSDSVILFDGNNLNQWEHNDSSKPKWIIENNSMIVNPGTGNLYTKKAFTDIQFHIEWKTPIQISGDGQNRGNSGIFFQNRYELQILDSFNNVTYSNGQAASIYKQHIPLVNASKMPGEWQSYDVIFIAPKFDSEGNLTKRAEMTVFHNGILVQNKSIILGSTVYKGLPEYKSHPAKEPIMIQDHSNKIAFRNIWLREL